MEAVVGRSAERTAIAVPSEFEGMNVMNPSLQFRPSASGAAAVPGQYRKDCLRIGRFIAREAASGRRVELDVSGDRLNRWIAAFNTMRSQGIEVDLTVDHGTDARSRRGRILSLFRASSDGSRLIADPDGEVLAFDAEVADEETALLARRCPHVSVEIEPDFIDGRGRHYGEAITAISIVRQPVVAGQWPFERIAAGRVRSAECLLLHGHDEMTQRWPRPRPARTQSLHGASGMFNEQQMQRLCRLLEVGESEAGDSIGEIICERIELALHDRDKARNALHAAKQQIGTGGEGEGLDPELIEEAVENCREKLDRLIEQGRLSPAAGEKLAAALLGEAGSRPAICLSRRAASNAGLGQPLAKAVLEALAENEPVRLGEQTGAQGVALSRRDPAQGAEVDEEELTRRMIEQANGRAGQPAL